MFHKESAVPIAHPSCLEASTNQSEATSVLCVLTSYESCLRFLRPKMLKSNLKILVRAEGFFCFIYLPLSLHILNQQSLKNNLEKYSAVFSS